MCQIDPDYKSPERIIDEEKGVSTKDRLKRLEKKALCFERKLDDILSLLEKSAENDRADHHARLSAAIYKLETDEANRL